MFFAAKIITAIKEFGGPAGRGEGAKCLAVKVMATAAEGGPGEAGAGGDGRPARARPGGRGPRPLKTGNAGRRGWKAPSPLSRAPGRRRRDATFTRRQQNYSSH